MCGCGIGRCWVRVLGAWLVRLACGFTGDFYGFAHGSEACGVPGRGGAVAVGQGSASDQKPGFRAQRRGAMPRRPSGGACAASGLAPRGGGTLARLRCCLWFRSGSLVASRPEGNQSGLVESSRITRCCGGVPSGWTPPERPDWLRPPTRRGIRNLPPVGFGHRSRTPRRRASAAAGAAKARRWPPPQGGRFRIPRRVGANRSPRRADGVKSMPHPSATRPTPPQRHGLYSGGPSWYPQPQRRDEGSGPDHKQHRNPPSVPLTLRARPLAAQAPPEGRRRHRAPGLGAKACRLWLLI